MANITCTTFAISSGSFDLSNDNLICSSTWTHSGGTFNGNTGNLFATTYTAGTSGVLNMGSGTWQANSTGTVWSVSVGALTLNSNTSTIAIANSTSTAINFSGGAKTYNNVSLTNASATGAFSFLSNTTFNDFSSVRTGAYVIKLPVTGSVTTNTWSVTGSPSGRVTLNSATSAGVDATGLTTTLTVTTGSVVVDYMTIRDVIANTDTGVIYDATAVNNIDGGGNLNWLFPLTARYWVGGAGTWDASTTTNWSTSPGGSGGASVPIYTTDVFFDANSGSGTVTVSSAISSNLNFSGYTGTFAGTGELNVYGSLVLPNSGFTFSNTLNFVANTSAFSRVIQTNGTSLSNPIIFNAGITGGAPNYLLLDDLTTSNIITISSGFVNLNNENVTANSIISSGTNFKRLLMSNSNVILTSNVGGVIYNGTTLPVTSTPNTTINIAGNTGAAAVTFAGNTSQSYGTLLFSNTTSSGTIAITGTTLYFSNIASLRSGSSYTLNLPASTTTNIANFYVSGSSGFPVTVGGSGAVATVNLDTAANGSIVADWLIMTNFTGTPYTTPTTTATTINWALGDNTIVPKTTVNGVVTLTWPRKVAAITAVGSSTWPIPSDWDPLNNRIVLLGGGGGGSGASGFATGSIGGGGGGGGGLRIIDNYSATAPSTVSYTVGAGGTAGPAGSPSVAGGGGTTSFGPQSATGGSGSTTNPASSTAGGNGGTGTYSGGKGGDASGFTGTPFGSGSGGGGGGGAAGLTSVGGAGGSGGQRQNNPTNPSSFSATLQGSGGGGAGGQNTSGSPGTNAPFGTSPYRGAGAVSTFGGSGGDGGSTSGSSSGTNLWGIFASGGGGGGGSSTGFAGGSYGGGGGGGRTTGPGTNNSGAAGQSGIILISYAPYVAPPVPPVSNNTSGMFLVI
jgi:hypothetical protein